MADIDELERAASAFPDLDDIIPSGAPAGGASFPALDEVDDMDTDFGALSSGGFGALSSGVPVSKAPTDIKVTGDDALDNFESQFPDLGASTYTSPPVSQQPSFYQTPAAVEQPHVYGGPIYTATTLEQPEEEPEVIKEWRHRQEELIRERDQAAEQKRQETISKAETAIDQFYKEYNSKKERNIAENKRAEEEYKNSLTDALASGTTWSRICDLIDLQNSQSKTIARAGPGTTDLTRMKEVLLRLRREGENAPGAAGY
ncbi:hypothetical protein FRB99_005023 [Tulasnella sp. 403]|nr:hypothetical protein FRB99_005023 [Tulasnella sp. 403]